MDNEQRFDTILPIKIQDEMENSYMAYSMSVIVSRALPDVRDGLKPVHRRILYSMNELNLDPSKPHKKSSRIVGDTMGKYHPHGNTSIYDAMVRMAQPFSMRYMLVDGHGNFGSVDGDGAAAERYTEARMAKLSLEMLSDIEKETVDFMPNYDNEGLEPTVLPARFPNLLVNGSTGIAVGMATNIPPHNLTEVINAMIVLLDAEIEEREVDIEEIIEHIKGPDFPTAATILGQSGIKAAYRTGRGKVMVRAVCEIEPIEGSQGREMIVVTELPYAVNKARLVEKIGELVRDKKIEGISDLRDESDRHGIRVVIELKKDVNANVLLNQLYKFTSLQDTCGIILLALVENEPRILNIKSMLTHYIDHQKDVVTRRTQFDLNKAEKRAHILEGYVKAHDNIDEVLEIMKSSKDTATAKTRLIERFDFSEEQVSAIVEMRFRSLTGLEREKLTSELTDLQFKIGELKRILEDKTRLVEIIKEEAVLVRDKFGDERRTKIVPYVGDIDMEDLIEDEASVITMTQMGYIKRLPLNTYKSQNRGGKGILGMQTREEDIVNNLYIANTHDYLLFFTSRGRAHRMKVYEIAEAGRTAKGTNLVNLLNLTPEEKVAAVIPYRDSENAEEIKYSLTMITKKGIIKKTDLSSFKKINKNGLIALQFKNDDELISVLKTESDMTVFMATRNGIGIRFAEDDIRSMGRMATGVRGIRLQDDDEVIGAVAIDINSEFKLLFVSEKGFGKCSTTDEFKIQNRGGQGTRNYKISDKTGKIVGISLVNDNEELMLINSEGVIIRMKINEISTVGRVASGVKLITLADGVTVVGMSKIAESHLDEEDYSEEGIENTGNIENAQENTENIEEKSENDSE